MKISVIICAYNMEKYIDRCVRSAVSQNYPDYEILLINDGSDDSTPDRCREWAEKSEGIIYISHDNIGLGESRNRGIKASSGDYVTFLDADDWISPNYLSVLTKSAEMYDSDIVLSDLNYVTEDLGKRYERPSVIRLSEGVQNADDELNFFGRCRTFMCGKLFRKTLFTDNDLWIPSHNYEDISLTPYLLSRAKIISYRPGAFYYYLRNRSDSIINDPGQFSLILVSLRELAERFMADGSFEHNRPALMALFWGQICHFFKVTSGLSDDKKGTEFESVRSEALALFTEYFPEGEALVTNRYLIRGEDAFKKAVEHIVLYKDRIVDDYESADVIITDSYSCSDHDKKVNTIVFDKTGIAGESASWNLSDEIIARIVPKH